MISVPYYPTIGGPFTELDDGLCNRGTRIFGCKKMFKEETPICDG